MDTFTPSENPDVEVLSPEERRLLLDLARQAIEQAVCAGQVTPIDLAGLPERLRAPGAAFVTLTRRGSLRGCIGALEATQPLAEDVITHAAAAAREDYRFAPVRAAELPDLKIEISRLTPPVPLAYEDPPDLLARLRPMVDGVVLKLGHRRATFLPQVWQKVPTPEEFLSHLCLKMSLPPDMWQQARMEVFVYQVEEFTEEQV